MPIDTAVALSVSAGVQRVWVPVRYVSRPRIHEILPVPGDRRFAHARHRIADSFNDVGMVDLVLHGVGTAGGILEYQCDGIGDIAGIRVMKNHPIAAPHADRRKVASLAERGGKPVFVDFPAACAMPGAGQPVRVDLREIFGQIGRHRSIATEDVTGAVVGGNMVPVAGHEVVFDKHRIRRSKFKRWPGTIAEDNDAVAEIVNCGIVVIDELAVVNHPALLDRAAYLHAGKNEFGELGIRYDEIDTSIDQTEAAVFAVGQVGAHQGHVGKLGLFAVAAVETYQVGVNRHGAASLEDRDVDAGAFQKNACRDGQLVATPIAGPCRDRHGLTRKRSRDGRLDSREGAGRRPGVVQCRHDF